MFGLQNKEQHKKEALFDLEAEIKENPLKLKEYILKIESRINKIKTLMRAGGGKDSYDKYNTLLLGYTGALKILSRIKIKK